MRKIQAVDLFCGAGGTSTGIVEACRESGRDVDLLAINHWDIAIATHTENHPELRHLCESLDSVDPRKVVGGELDLLVASPECTHHSRARGGRPVEDQSRATAWHVCRWAEALRPKWILVENVKEFRDWAPIGSNGRPLKSKKGHTFAAFLNALRSLGYVVEDRILNAADYGDPTSRERLFIACRRGNRRIPWPEPTHGKRTEDLFEDRKPWRAAREIIDWKIPGNSIFNRKRPLAPATMRRIEAGLKRFGGPAAEPFLVVLRNNQDARSLDDPLPTVTCSGAHFALCKPFILPHRVNSTSDGHVDSIEDPVRCFTATNGGGYLVEPFILSQNSSGAPRSVDSPIPTLTTTSRGVGLVEPFIMKYNSNGGPRSIEEPLETITTKDRFGLVQPEEIDITFRMLQPHELSAAMGFPMGYRFTGNKSEQVKQIGNAVCVNLSKALCRAFLEA